MRQHKVSCPFFLQLLVFYVSACLREEQDERIVLWKDMDGDSSDDQLTHHSNESSDDAPSSSEWKSVPY